MQFQNKQVQHLTLVLILIQLVPSVYTLFTCVQTQDEGIPDTGVINHCHAQASGTCECRNASDLVICLTIDCVE